MRDTRAACWRIRWVLPTMITLLGLCGCRPAATPPAAQAEGASPAESAEEADHAEPPVAPETWSDHLALREQLDRQLWAAEVEAQQHEQPFVDLWDTLRTVASEFDTLGNFSFQQLAYGAPRLAADLPLGIREYLFDQAPTTLGPAQWHELLADLERRGYRLLQSEWHHSRYQPATDNTPASSVVSFVLDIKCNEPAQRVTLRGNLNVTWARPESATSPPKVERLELSDATALVRDAPPAFSQILSAGTTTGFPRVLPLLLYDLDGNGGSEIILGGLNRIYWNDGHGNFTAKPLAVPAVEMFDASVLADFTGDGHVDLLCVGNQRFPLLLEGSASGQFAPPRQCADFSFELPKSFTAGDIDGDGDLDVWIGQYKFPYIEGSMPTPFYDSNDGYPAVLLENDGQGNFRDITDSAGLAVKRNRRTYSSSLVDLDGDGDLDLMTVNDFCGVDVYENDGQGKFRDVTETWLTDRHLFGMGHTLADYNGDGSLDMYLIGMSSTTARRLDRLNLGRSDHPDINAKRQVMGYGNRMMLFRSAADDPRYQQAPWNDQIARTGWSWGTTSWDVDNDTHVDLYVANGHNSGQSARDYCTRYWCHDVYTGSSESNPELLKLFGHSLQELHQGKISWNGFEHNVLWLNLNGERFVNAALLFGVGFEFDGRAVASEDLDNDGRKDLLVVRFASQTVEQAEYELVVMRNELETGHHWIGVRLSESITGRSPIGAKVNVILRDGRRLVQQIVTGDSFSTQHAPTVHFGLGEDSQPERLEVQWQDGTQWSLDAPAADTYHAPERAEVAEGGRVGG